MMSHVTTTKEAHELAQSGTAFPDYSLGRLGFSVRHMADKPGVLMKMLRDGHLDDIDELLASAAYGAGYVMMLNGSDNQLSLSRDQSVNADVASMDGSDVHFQGGGNPNPSFIFEGHDPIDVLIVINPERTSVTRADGLVLTDVISEICDHVVGQRAPILTLQSPVQLPRLSKASDEKSYRLERWRPPTGFGVRFSAALGRSGYRRRVEFVESLRRFCADRGLGLWLGDRRPGFRSGNWFRIHQHAGDVFREYAESFNVDSAAVGLVLSFTAIGPARVGTSQAIVGALRGAGVSVLSTTIVAVRDMAFIHFGIAIRPGREEMDAARKVLGVFDIGSACARVGDLAGTRNGGSRELPLASSPAGDYLGLLGGAVQPRFVASKSERVLWASWEVPARPAAGRDSIVALLDTLREALELGEADEMKLPSVEYLSVRRTVGDRLRCRCKLSVDRQAVFSAAGQVDTRRAVQEFCNGAELRFRTKLVLADDTATSDCSIGWRESWLGRWSASSTQQSQWR